MLLLPRTAIVHVPKTGGQWVASAVSRACPEVVEVGPVHASPDEVADLPDWRCRPHRLAFVRHPLSWYASMWAHRMDERWAPVDDPAWFSAEWLDRWADFTRRTRDRTFAGFLWRALDAYPDGWVSSLFEAYTAGCTAVGRQEDLALDLQRLLRAAGETVDVAVLRSTAERNTRGATPARRRQCTIDPTLAAQVMDVEHRAASRFGYAHPPRWLRRRWRR